jgi:hypothetical protein
MHTGTDFPECVLCHALQAKQNFGICVSGGGFRATTLALGWVRILRREGILQAQILETVFISVFV